MTKYHSIVAITFTRSLSNDHTQQSLVPKGLLVFLYRFAIGWFFSRDAPNLEWTLIVLFTRFKIWQVMQKTMQINNIISITEQNITWVDVIIIQLINIVKNKTCLNQHVWDYHMEMGGIVGSWKTWRIQSWQCFLWHICTCGTEK